MKLFRFLSGSVLALVLFGCASAPSPTAIIAPPTSTAPTAEGARAHQLPVFKGAYLGQPRPGTTPEPFAPEIFAVDGRYGYHLHSSLFFSPDGQQVYFMNQSLETHQLTPLFIQQENDVWTAPQAAPLPDLPHSVTSFVFAPDWSRLYLYSNPAPENGPEDQDKSGFWVMERTQSGWSEALYIGPPADIERDDGTLYFSAIIPGGHGSHDVYRSRFIDGGYTDPENLGVAINSAAEEYVSCVAPDESYVIFYRFDRANPSQSGLYVTFRRPDDAWTEPVYLDDKLELAFGFAASLSPDGRYLFLLDRGSGLYWVDAAVMEQFRPE